MLVGILRRANVKFERHTTLKILPMVKSSIHCWSFFENWIGQSTLDLSTRSSCAWNAFMFLFLKISSRKRRSAFAATRSSLKDIVL